MNVSPSNAPTAKLTKNAASLRTRASLIDRVSSPPSETALTAVTLRNANASGPIYDQIIPPPLLHSMNDPS